MKKITAFDKEHPKTSFAEVDIEDKDLGNDSSYERGSGSATGRVSNDVSRLREEMNGLDISEL